MPIEGAYDMKDIESHPPVNPMTHRPYDSVLYVKTDSKGAQFKRVAIYDPGQVYVEYGIQYKRVPQQQEQQQMFNGMSDMQMNSLRMY